MGGFPANRRYGKAECCELLAFHGEETVRHVVSDRIPVANKPFTKVSFQETAGRVDVARCGALVALQRGKEEGSVW